MKERRVVVTGAGGVTAFGNSWDEIKPRLQLCRNAVRRMTDWDVYKGLNARIAAPVEDFTLPDTYTRKKTDGPCFETRGPILRIRARVSRSHQ